MQLGNGEESQELEWGDLSSLRGVNASFDGSRACFGKRESGCKREAPKVDIGCMWKSEWKDQVKSGLTSDRPHPHRRTQRDLPPIQARGIGPTQRAQNAGESRLDGAGELRRVSGTDGGEVERETHAGEVGEGAAEIVEALGLGEDGGDGDGALDGIG